MDIVILDGYTANPGDLSWEGFAKLGKLTVYDRTPQAEIVSRIGGAEIVITNKTPITADTLAACPGIRYIGVLATGYNIVDTAACKARSIPVTNIPGYSTRATAQMAIALLLEVCHHVGAHSDAVHQGRWQNSPDFCFWDYPLIELAGKTMGIIGYGSIGQTVAGIAHALGMDVIFYNRSPKDGGGIASQVTLDELYARAHVISLHCPLFPETTGLINRDSIAKMRDGVILINNARGPLLVDQDVADALASGKISAAAVDVAATEPIDPANPLLKAKNCIITPHFSWAPLEARIRLMQIATGNLQAFLDGKPVNMVNP